MVQQLLKELARKTIVSCIIYAFLFFLLYIVEFFVPAMKGHLLQWHIIVNGVSAFQFNWSFIIGIPASILGTAYVMTIANPRNYVGFYLGILMSILLSCQFFLQGNYDLVILYIFIFVPFQILSIVIWRRATLHPQTGTEFSPKFLSKRGFFVAFVISIFIIIGDYILATYLFGDVSHRGELSYQIAVKITSGCTIATSFLANYLMIYKKNDAWLCWILYCISSIVMFCIIGNIFSIVLFTIMLLVNASAQRAWLLGTSPTDFGWAGTEPYVNRILNQREKILRNFPYARHRKSYFFKN